MPIGGWVPVASFNSAGSKWLAPVMPHPDEFRKIKWKLDERGRSEETSSGGSWGFSGRIFWILAIKRQIFRVNQSSSKIGTVSNPLIETVEAGHILGIFLSFFFSSSFFSSSSPLSFSIFFLLLFLFFAHWFNTDRWSAILNSQVPVEANRWFHSAIEMIPFEIFAIPLFVFVWAVQLSRNGATLFDFISFFHLFLFIFIYFYLFLFIFIYPISPLLLLPPPHTRDVTGDSISRRFPHPGALTSATAAVSTRSTFNLLPFFFCIKIYLFIHFFVFRLIFSGWITTQFDWIRFKKTNMYTRT